MTQAEFDDVVKFLEGAFRDHLTAGQRDAYALMWTEEDGPTLMRRAIEYARSDRARYGFPKPGDLLKQAMDPKVRAELAWAAFSEHSDYELSLQMSDTLIHRVVEDLGGYCYILDHACPEPWTQVERRFKARYEAYCTSPPASCPAYMPGFHELQNHEKWPGHVPPVRKIACEYDHERLPTGPPNLTLPTEPPDSGFKRLGS